MATIVVKCRHCGESEGVVKMGKSKSGAQRCRCKSCGKTFQLDYTYEASKPGVKERILAMSVNGSGVADTVRLLKRHRIKVKKWFCDDWGAYPRCLKPGKVVIGKANTQKIERKNLDFRTRIKRLARRTICFSKNTLMHDTVIALFINHVAFNLPCTL